MAEVRFHSSDAPAEGVLAVCDEKIKQLTDMGFDIQLCRDVLTACGGNMDQAINRLLGM